MSRKQKKMLARILISAALLIALNFIPVTGWPRFACYKTTSKQQPVALYKGTSTVGITNVAANGGDAVDVFTVAGTKIRSNVARENALNGLDKGVYIIGNKKYFVK